MKTALVCFTANGFQTEKRLVSILKGEGHDPCPFVMGKYAMQAAAADHEISFMPIREGGLLSWAGERFADSDALIFIGACGIAVRAIAPYVKDKKTDPAVLVLDESAAFAIPLLSGHLGGANELAAKLAEKTGAVPVVTTATDVNRRFAVDVFAKEHGLVIDDMRLAKEISADILEGEPVGIFCDFPLGDRIPAGLYKDRICRRNIRITIHRKEIVDMEDNRILRLIPRCMTLGIGCRRGTSEDDLLKSVTAAMESHGLDVRAICALSSIDLKSGETGLNAMAQDMGLPFLTYSQEELARIPGEFSESEFVKKTTGVGNVCERAAMAACLEVSKQARLIVGKQAADGVTVAAACFWPEMFGKMEIEDA